MRTLAAIILLLVIGAIIIGFAESIPHAKERQYEIKQGQQNPAPNSH